MATERTTPTGGDTPHALSDWRLILPRYLGYGFYWAWTFLCFRSSVLFPWSSNAESNVSTLFVVSLAANAVMLVILFACAPRLLSRHEWRRNLLIAATLLTTLGTLATLLAQGSSALKTTWLITAGVTTGFGTAWLVVHWGEFYASIGTRRAAMYMSASVVLAVVIFFLAVTAAPVVGILLTASLPALSALALWANVRQENVRPESAAPIRAGDEGPRFPLPWRFAAGMGLYGVVFGLNKCLDSPLTGAAFHSSQSMVVAGSGAIALLLAVGTIMFSKDLDFGFTYRPILPVMIAGFMALPFLGASVAVFARGIIGASYTFFEMLCWILVSNMVYWRRLPAIRTFGAARATVIGSILLGWIAGFAATRGLAPTSGQLTIYALIMVFILVISTVMVLSERDILELSSSAAEHVASVAEESEKVAGQWRQRCKRVAEKYGLSTREEEVLMLLAKGRSLAVIRDTLGIASGTVRTHVYHVYQKVGVHSRQELLDLIEDRPASEIR